MAYTHHHCVGILLFPVDRARCGGALISLVCMLDGNKAEKYRGSTKPPFLPE
jgi:hypothetical protein